MAIFIRHNCSECGEQVLNDDKSKWYIHASQRRGVKSDHKVPGVTVVKRDEAGQLVAA